MFKNAKLVGFGVAPVQYNVEDCQRGEPGFTVRAHVLTEILRNANRWKGGYESPQSKAMAFGSLFDCLLLTPKQWYGRYAVLPSDAPRKPTKAQLKAKKPSPETVAAIEWWEAWQKNNPGEIVSQELNAQVHSACNRLLADGAIVDLLDASRRAAMVTADWADGATGITVPVKCLIDLVPSYEHPVFSNSLYDLKTTKNASPRSFSMDAMQYGYAVQGAFYLDLWNAATGEKRTDFGHVVMESYHPYEFRTPPPLLTQRFLGHGRALYQRAMSIYCRALSTGVWPSYDRPGGDWPLTDCADWYLMTETLYEPAENEPEDEPEEEITPTEDDLVP